jgi:hypothetical protein
MFIGLARRRHVTARAPSSSLKLAKYVGVDVLEFVNI